MTHCLAAGLLLTARFIDNLPIRYRPFLPAMAQRLAILAQEA